MEEIANLIFNNGVGVACLCFMFYFMQTTMKDVTNTLKELEKSLILIQTKIDTLERK